MSARSWSGFFPLVFTLAVCLSLSFVLRASASTERVKLKVFLKVVSTDSTIGSKADLAVLQAFQKKYPYIDVISGTGLALDPETGPLMAVAGGTSPDVISVNFRQSDTYIRQSMIQPLDRFIAKLPRKELDERFIPGARPVIYRRGPDGRKHYYAVPYKVLVRALFYRKDLFRAVGLKPDRPPQTWNELLDYSRRLTNPHKGIYGIAMTSGTDVSWDWYSFLSSAGGKAMVEDKSGGWRLAYGSDAGERSAYFFAKLMQEPFRRNGKVIASPACSDRDRIDKFKRGEVGMIVDYLDDKLVSNVDPFVVGIAPVPSDGLGHHGSELNCGMMGLFAGVKDQKVKDAAFKFIWFWDGPEARKIRTEVYVDNGYGGFVNPLLLRKYGYTEYLKYVPRGWEKTINLALKYGNPEPYGQNCQTVFSVMDRPIQQILAEKLGSLPPKKAMPRIRRILNRSVIDGREKLLDQVPPNVLRVRRAVALIVALVMLASFTWVFRYLMKIFTPADKAGKAMGWAFKNYWLAYVLLLPAVGSIFLWQYIPLIRGAGIAFYNYRIMGGSNPVGLDNFADILFDPFFWKCVWNTFYYAGLWLGLGFFAPIILALFLSEVPRLKVFYRVMFYLPAVISSIVVMFMWKSFYDPSAIGMLNQVLALFHISPQMWLQDPKLAMLCVILPTVWAGMGPGCLIYLAALKSVPEELYEAADIDGAGTLRKVWGVTVPMIKPLIIINLTGAFIGAFNSADFVLVMTGGGPNYSTHVMGLEIFYNAFLFLKFGRAAALGWLMGLLLLGFTAYQMKRLSNMTFKAGGS